MRIGKSAVECEKMLNIDWNEQTENYKYTFSSITLNENDIL